MATSNENGADSVDMAEDIDRETAEIHRGPQDEVCVTVVFSGRDLERLGVSSAEAVVPRIRNGVVFLEPVQ